MFWKQKATLREGMIYASAHLAGGEAISIQCVMRAESQSIGESALCLYGANPCQYCSQNQLLGNPRSKKSPRRDKAKVLTMLPRQSVFQAAAALEASTQVPC